MHAWTASHPIFGIADRHQRQSWPARNASPRNGIRSCPGAGAVQPKRNGGLERAKVIVDRRVQPSQHRRLSYGMPSNGQPARRSGFSNACSRKDRRSLGVAASRQQTSMPSACTNRTANARRASVAGATPAIRIISSSVRPWTGVMPRASTPRSTSTSQAADKRGPDRSVACAARMSSDRAASMSMHWIRHQARRAAGGN